MEEVVKPKYEYKKNRRACRTIEVTAAKQLTKVD